MSVKYQKYHRKGKRVFAQFKPGTVERSRTFTLNQTRYTYLIIVRLDSEEKSYKYMPEDVEEFSINKL